MMDIFYPVSLVLILAMPGSGVLRCSLNIPNGRVDDWCQQTSGSACTFSCHDGYNKHSNVTWLKCSNSSTWESAFPVLGSAELDELCAPKSCPFVIPNGGFSDGCSGTTDSVCGYFCQSGFDPNPQVSQITCLPTTTWSTDLHTLCSNANQCPYEIPNGDLSISCTRVPDDKCSYSCRQGYVPSLPVSSRELTCEKDFTWTAPLSLSALCMVPMQCPATIENGFLEDTCSRLQFTYCRFSCKLGWYNREGIPTVQCNIFGQWDIHHSDVLTTTPLETPCVDTNYIGANEEFHSLPDRVPDYVIPLCIGIGCAIIAAIIITCTILYIKRRKRRKGKSGSSSHSRGEKQNSGTLLDFRNSRKAGTEYDNISNITRESNKVYSNGVHSNGISSQSDSNASVNSFNNTTQISSTATHLPKTQRPYRNFDSDRNHFHKSKQQNTNLCPPPYTPDVPYRTSDSDEKNVNRHAKPHRKTVESENLESKHSHVFSLGSERHSPPSTSEVPFQMNRRDQNEWHKRTRKRDRGDRATAESYDSDQTTELTEQSPYVLGVPFQTSYNGKNNMHRQRRQRRERAEWEDPEPDLSKKVRQLPELPPPVSSSNLSSHDDNYNENKKHGKLRSRNGKMDSDHSYKIRQLDEPPPPVFTFDVPFQNGNCGSYINESYIDDPAETTV